MSMEDELGRNKYREKKKRSSGLKSKDAKVVY
jgi:hypothetical protein